MNPKLLLKICICNKLARRFCGCESLKALPALSRPPLTSLILQCGLRLPNSNAKAVKDSYSSVPTHSCVQSHSLCVFKQLKQDGFCEDTKDPFGKQLGNICHVSYFLTQRVIPRTSPMGPLSSRAPQDLVLEPLFCTLGDLIQSHDFKCIHRLITPKCACPTLTSPLNPRVCIRVPT